MTTQKMLTSRDLMAQADALRAKAQALLNKERPAALASVKQSISMFGFTQDELGFGKTGSVPKKKAKAASVSAKAKKSPAKKKGAGVVKFTDGQGNSWTGFGPRPGWFKTAIASGMTEDALRV